MFEPVVTRVEWSVIDVSHPERGGDGRVSLMGEDGSVNNSLDLPTDTMGELNETGKSMLEAYASGKRPNCYVLSSMNKEQMWSGVRTKMMRKGKREGGGGGRWERDRGLLFFCNVYVWICVCIRRMGISISIELIYITS